MTMTQTELQTAELRGAVVSYRVPGQDTASGKPPRSVKNLRWLLAHARECEKIALKRKSSGTLLIAWGETPEYGWTYTTMFACPKVAREWINRRALAHVEQRDLTEA